MTVGLLEIRRMEMTSDPNRTSRERRFLMPQLLLRNRLQDAAPTFRVFHQESKL